MTLKIDAMDHNFKERSASIRFRDSFDCEISASFPVEHVEASSQDSMRERIFASFGRKAKIKARRPPVAISKNLSTGRRNAAQRRIEIGQATER